MNDSSSQDEKKRAYLLRRAEMMRLMERHIRKTENVSGNEMSQDSFLSRYHFQRVFQSTTGETPSDMQRRLRLERAAVDLRRTSNDVTDIAFDAGFSTLEGFSRAFRRAYGLSPSRFRNGSNAFISLKAASLVHINAETRMLTGQNQLSGDETMDLTDRLLENDFETKRLLLEAAASLSDQQLDAPLAYLHCFMPPWCEPSRTLRDILNRMSYDGWAAVMMDRSGWAVGDIGYRSANVKTVPEMIARLDAYQADYFPFIQKIKKNNEWDSKWVDDTCEPVETFSYGTVIESSLTHGIVHRFAVQALLEQLGLSFNVYH